MRQQVVCAQRRQPRMDKTSVHGVNRNTRGTLHFARQNDTRNTRPMTDVTRHTHSHPAHTSWLRHAPRKAKGVDVHTHRFDCHEPHSKGSYHGCADTAHHPPMRCHGLDGRAAQPPCGLGWWCQSRTLGQCAAQAMVQPARGSGGGTGRIEQRQQSTATATQPRVKSKMQ